MGGSNEHGKSGGDKAGLKSFVIVIAKEPVVGAHKFKATNACPRT